MMTILCFGSSEELQTHVNTLPDKQGAGKCFSEQSYRQTQVEQLKRAEEGNICCCVLLGGAARMIRLLNAGCSVVTGLFETACFCVGMGCSLCDMASQCECSILCCSSESRQRHIVCCQANSLHLCSSLKLALGSIGVIAFNLITLPFECCIAECCIHDKIAQYNRIHGHLKEEKDRYFTFDDNFSVAHPMQGEEIHVPQVNIYPIDLKNRNSNSWN